MVSREEKEEEGIKEHKKNKRKNKIKKRWKKSKTKKMIELEEYGGQRNKENRKVFQKTKLDRMQIISDIFSF